MGRPKKEIPPATELMENPLIVDEPETSGGDTPFDKAYDVLTATGGKRLELMTRTTPKLAEAIAVGYTMIFNYRSGYLQGKIDTVMRSHVSIAGKGRTEMVQSLQAGSGVPGEYYDQGNAMKNSFIDVDDEDVPNEPE